MLGAMVGIGQVTTSGGPLMVPTPGVKYTGDSWSSPPGTTPTSIGTPTAPEIGNPSVPELPPVG